jgi:hypothetical protein
MQSARQAAVVNSNRFGPAAVGIIHGAKLRVKNSNSKKYIGSIQPLILMNLALCSSNIGRHIEYYEN